MWASCANNLFGVFDPPIALTLQAGLTTPKATPAQPTISGGEKPPPQPTAVPANGPTPPAPSPTPQPQTTNAAQLANIPPPNGPLLVNLSPVGKTPTPPPGVLTVTIEPSLVVNGQTVTANSQGSFVIRTQTLTAGGLAITISGKTISLATGATEIIYGGTSTTHLGSVIQSSKSVTTAPAQYTSGADRVVEMGMARAVCIAVAFSALIAWL